MGAEELQLKGLMGKPDERVEDFKVDEKCQPSTFTPPMNTNIKIPKTSFKSSNIYNSAENRALVIPSNFSGDLEELEKRVKSMMEKSQYRTARGREFAHLCKVCGKEGMSNAIKDHIE